MIDGAAFPHSCPSVPTCALTNTTTATQLARHNGQYVDAGGADEDVGGALDGTDGQGAAAANTTLLDQWLTQHALDFLGTHASAQATSEDAPPFLLHFAPHAIHLCEHAICTCMGAVDVVGQGG